MHTVSDADRTRMSKKLDEFANIFADIIGGKRRKAGSFIDPRDPVVKDVLAAIHALSSALRLEYDTRNDEP